jgi:hypothetical protein
MISATSFGVSQAVTIQVARPTAARVEMCDSPVGICFQPYVPLNIGQSVLVYARVWSNFNSEMTSGSICTWTANNAGVTLQANGQLTTSLIITRRTTERGTVTARCEGVLGVVNY